MNVSVKMIKEVLFQDNLLEKYDIDRIGIFGSVARGEPAKDIDILIDQVKDYRKILAFKNELANKLCLPVDIMLLPYANPIVLYRARKDMIYVSRDSE